ncbi:MAG: hypothetical protein FJ265_09090 [Planctomycetes bacterium]|nr:hypothetical protein [Planctomycetota bacterium]
MTAPAPARRRRTAKLVLVACSVLFAALVGELALRLAGGYRLGSLRLAQVTGAGSDGAAVLARAPDLVTAFTSRWRRERPDLDLAWLSTSPPPVPRQPPLGKPVRPQHDWLLHYYVTNAALLRALWVKGQGLPMLPGLALPDEFTVFEPPGGKLVPRYRYPASCTLPGGMVTNAFGFRGRELAVDKPARTVRIGFVGASTTVEAQWLPHTAPDLVEHWLGLWAARRGLDVKFETLNAAREAIRSADLRAIVADELLPLEVDYVVYYEGANQFEPGTLRKHVQIDGDYQLASPPPGLVGNYDEVDSADTTLLDSLASWSAAARYLRSALQRGERRAEPAKPTQRIALPPELLQGPFPLARAGEVLELAAIGGDLAGIRQDLEARGARLVLATFWWLAEDGLSLDPVWGRNVFVLLNRAYWPFRYATLRALADVQNRFFAAWGEANGVAVLDVDAELPHDERLAIDAVHHNELGVRLKAWVLFAGLTALLDRDLAAGRLPVPDAHRDAGHPNLGPPTVLTRAQLDAR